MSILDFITPEEKKAIDYFRENYGVEPEFSANEDMASTDTFLHCWAENKMTLFNDLFKGEGLIKEFPFKTETTESVIERYIDDDWCDISDYIWYFRSWNDKTYFQEYKEGGWDDDLTFGRFSEVLSPSGLAKRKFTKDIDFGEGIVIKAGTKITTALKKLNKHFNIIPQDELEKFIVRYSLFFNQKYLEGILCLSIHPLDYITMSENESGWDSCMKWKGRGCYRRGTLEMMNSKNVIVAYLKAKEDMYLCSDVPKWNNKKWRQLVIAEPNVIVGVKGYPYCNEPLICEALKHVKENTNYVPADCGILEAVDSHFENENNTKRCYFETDAMYNDFGCQDHWGYVNFESKMFENDSERWINYSGPSTCVWCGRSSDTIEWGTNDDYDEQSCLMCSNCYTEHRCADCCDTLYGEGYWTRDGQVCEYCFENHYQWCEYEQEYLHNRDLVTVYFSKDGMISNNDELSIVLPEWNFERILNSIFDSGVKFNWCGIAYVEINELTDFSDIKDMVQFRETDLDELNFCVMQ